MLFIYRIIFTYVQYKHYIGYFSYFKCTGR